MTGKTYFAIQNFFQLEGENEHSFAAFVGNWFVY